ncbi:NADH-quinone oxidoreductase subunit L [Marinobacteraceae bacterium S3BR75-40.1]
MPMMDIVRGITALWQWLPFVLVGLAMAVSLPRLPLVQRWAHRVLVLAVSVSAVAAVLFTAGLWQPLSAPGLWVHLDGLAIWMGLLVSFIAWVNLRYARRYMAGDPGEARFLRWFLVAVAAVELLVSTSHLLVLAAAWILISLALHPLLLLYDRFASRDAASQKFLVSRLGDAALVVGVVLLYQRFGSFDLLQIGAAVTQADAASLTGPAIAFAMAAVLQCAQIPFHGWLIRVMEAPTPVSALLHAGIINLGGFLWLRMAPVFEANVAGHGVLLLFGAITVVLASLVMMQQSSIKHTLAWSTSAQMGFMLLELGLGAYTLALLHLIAHSLYKAHAFLSTGRVVTAPSIGVDSRMSSSRLLGVLVVAVPVAAYAAGSLWNVHPVILLILGLAAVQAAVGVLPSLPRRLGWIPAVFVAVLPLAYGLWHGLLGGVVGNAAVSDLFLQPAVALPLLLLFTLFAAGVMALQWAPAHPLCRRLRAHCQNDFYLAEPLDRLSRVVHRTLTSRPLPRTQGPAAQVPLHSSLRGAGS